MAEPTELRLEGPARDINVVGVKLVIKKNEGASVQVEGNQTIMVVEVNEGASLQAEGN